MGVPLVIAGLQSRWLNEVVGNNRLMYLLEAGDKTKKRDSEESLGIAYYSVISRLRSAMDMQLVHRQNQQQEYRQQS
jgi:hypothetical protein